MSAIAFFFSFQTASIFGNDTMIWGSHCGVSHESMAHDARDDCSTVPHWNGLGHNKSQARLITCRIEGGRNYNST